MSAGLVSLHVSTGVARRVPGEAAGGVGYLGRPGERQKETEGNPWPHPSRQSPWLLEDGVSTGADWETVRGPQSPRSPLRLLCQGRCESQVTLQQDKFAVNWPQTLEHKHVQTCVGFILRNLAEAFLENSGHCSKPPHNTVYNLLSSIMPMH